MTSGELAGTRDDSPQGYGTRLLEDYAMKRGLVFGSIIVAAMLAFELFNYSTTDYALANLVGDLRFMGLRWAMILAIAFCGMDFAGIARLFTPEKGRAEHVEVWYLLAAWFLAATMNAMLTWWGVSLALLQDSSLGNEILSRETLLAVVPVFVAIMIWLIRILIIGTLSMAGERLFNFGQPDEAKAVEPDRRARPAIPVPGLHLLTAMWRGTANPGRAEPARSQIRPAAGTLGAPARDEPDEQRGFTVAERHGYGRGAQPHRPAVQPGLPGQPVRPAPKPTSQPTLVRQVPPQRPVTHAPAPWAGVARASQGSGQGNGVVNGNGHGDGNGNGSGHDASRSFDPDLDD